MQDDKSRFIPILAEIMQETGALKPQGAMATDLEGWRESLERRATRSVETSERGTLGRVERTWRELQTFIAMKGIVPGELGVVALECFLFASSAPSRVYAAMQWMRNNLQLP